MEIWQNLFKDYTTGYTFVLNVTKTQVYILLNTARSDAGDKTAAQDKMQFALSIPAGRRLKEKGLVYCPDPEFQGVYALTPAGKHVVELIKMAGFKELV